MVALNDTRRAGLKIPAMVVCLLIVIWWTPSVTSAQAEPDRSPPDDAEKADKEKLQKKFLPSSEGEFKRLQNGVLQVGKVKIFPQSNRITFPAEINQTLGYIEVLIATMEGRLHESLLRTKARPLHVQLALYLLGLDNGMRLPDDKSKQGDMVHIDILWGGNDGDNRHQRPVEDWVLDTRTDEHLERTGWVFVGSRVKDDVFLADRQGNIVLVYSYGATVLDIPDPDSKSDMMFKVDVPEDETAPAAEGDAVRVQMTPSTGGSS